MPSILADYWFKISKILSFCHILFFCKNVIADSYIPEVTITPSYLDKTIEFGKQQTYENNKQQQKDTILNALRQIPGVQSFSYGDSTIQNYVKLRGANTEHTAVRIFGLKINDVANGGRFDFTNIVPSDIQSTEVHNFSSESTIGGTIDLVPQQGYGPLQTTLDIEGGSYNTLRTQGSLSGSTEKSDYYLAAHTLKSGTGSLAHKRLGTTLTDRSLNRSFTTRLGHVMTPHWHTDLYTSCHQTYTQDSDILNGLPHKSGNHGLYQRHFIVMNNHFKTLYHLWDHDVALGHSQSRYNQFFEPTSAYLNKGQSFKGTYNTRFKFHPHQHLLTSVGITQDITKQNNLKGHTLKSHHMQLTYLNDLVPHLILETRGRLDKQTFSKTHGTYFGSAKYYIKPTLVFFTHYGTGFEAPTAFDFYSSSFSSVDNLTLKPVTSQNFDLGVETKPYSSLTLSLSYFRNNIHNLLTTIKNAQGKYQRVNLEGRSIQGLESSVRYKLNQDTRLRAAYTLTDAIDRPSNLRSIRLARHQIHTGIDFVYQEKTTLFTELSYESPTKDIDFYSGPAKRVTLPATINLRLGGAYKMTDYLEITTRLENALRRQAEYIYGYAGRGLGIYAGLRFKN